MSPDELREMAGLTDTAVSGSLRRFADLIDALAAVGITGTDDSRHQWYGSLWSRVHDILAGDDR